MPPQNQRPPDNHEELVQPDDSIIGRAVRRSLVSALLAAVVAGGIFWAMKRTPDAPPSQVTPLTAPSAANRATAETPLAKFTDVTSGSGIVFRHYNGAYGEKLLPETMGSGVAFLDFDGDGAPDLLFVNSADWPWHVAPSGKAPTLELFR